MEPTAAEIERESQVIVERPGATSKPRTRLDQQAAHRRIVQPPGGCNSGRAAADDHNLRIIDCHSIHRSGSLNHALTPEQAASAAHKDRPVH
jgi:hypothetical protein